MTRPAKFNWMEWMEQKTNVARMQEKVIKWIEQNAVDISDGEGITCVKPPFVAEGSPRQSPIAGGIHPTHEGEDGYTEDEIKRRRAMYDWDRSQERKS